MAAGLADTALTWTDIVHLIDKVEFQIALGKKSN
jgi:hypothetical protein